MNKIGIHFGYFNRDWDTDFIRQIDQVKKAGFDILETAPAPLMKLSKEQRKEIADHAKEQKIELTFSVGLSREYDLASKDAAVRNNGIAFTLDTFNIMEEMGSTLYSGVDIGAWNTTYDYGVVDKRAELKRSVDSVKEMRRQ